jgi:hypothetical protein
MPPMVVSCASLPRRTTTWHGNRSPEFWFGGEGMAGQGGVAGTVTVCVPPGCLLRICPDPGSAPGRPGGSLGKRPRHGVRGACFWTRERKSFSSSSRSVVVSSRTMHCSRPQAMMATQALSRPGLGGRHFWNSVLRSQTQTSDSVSSATSRLNPTAALGLCLTRTPDAPRYRRPFRVGDMFEPLPPGADRFARGGCSFRSRSVFVAQRLRTAVLQGSLVRPLGRLRWSRGPPTASWARW